VSIHQCECLNKKKKKKKKNKNKKKKITEKVLMKFGNLWGGMQ
jgi:hypothetical protein